MTASKVIAFVKFFTDESHADQFMKGILFMRKLRYFQQGEANDRDDGRGDRHEAVVSWHQPDRIELLLDFHGVDPIKIGKTDLAGPVAVTRNFYFDMYVFCISTLAIPDPSLLVGDHDEVESKLQAAFQIHERCLEFGPHAVVVSAQKFIPHLRRGLEQCNHWFRAGMVDYYDETTFHGEFAAEDVPFRKQSRFSYQKEFRVCLQAPITGDETLAFDVGDMSSFAIKACSADINAMLKLKLKQPLS